MHYIQFITRAKYTIYHPHETSRIDKCHNLIFETVSMLLLSQIRQF
jgi:hypothetical protein